MTTIVISKTLGYMDDQGATSSKKLSEFEHYHLVRFYFLNIDDHSILGFLVIV